MGTWKDSQSRGEQTLVQMFLSLFLVLCDMDRSYPFPVLTFHSSGGSHLLLHV